MLKLPVCLYSVFCKFNSLKVLFVLLALALASPVADAQPFAYVVNQQMNTVTVINTLDNSVTGSISVGNSPTQVAIAPDARRAYLTQGDGTVAVIDLAGGSVVTTIPVGILPSGVAVSPNGVYVYVTNEGSDTVSVIGTSSLSVIATIPVGTKPHGVAFTPDSARAYVTNIFSGQVSVIDTGSRTVTTNVNVQSGPAAVALSPSGALAYVSNQYSNTVSVVQTLTNSVVATIPVGLFPNSLAVAANGARAYVTNANTSTVSIIDTVSNAVIGTAPVGTLPTSIAVTPDGAHAYVTNARDYSVSVIDTNTSAVFTLPRIGIYPSGVAITPAPQTGVNLTLGPSGISLRGGQSQSFTASVTGTSNLAVNWSMSPAVGSLSGSGLAVSYNAPAIISGSQTVTLTASSAADPSKAASITVSLIPVSVSVTPPSVTLTNAQSQQCSAQVNGAGNSAVTWSINPVVGSISASGLYTAPAILSSGQTIAVTATSQADPGKSGSASMILVAGTPLPGPATIRVNAGGGAYTDPQGNVWSADTGFNGGSSYSNPQPIAGTSTPALYQKEHYSTGPFQYSFDVANGNYTVNLKFAEIYFTSAGRRVFNVAVNGQTVLPNFDPAQAGGAFTAVDRQFPVTVGNGQIVIQLTPVADFPTISAIEILPQTAPAAFTAIRINAGGAALTDAQGNAWSADTGFNTGFSYSNPRPVGGTSTPALYQKEHYSTGPFQYSFSVPNGTYSVNLKFAEIYYTSAGNRIFNVAINGQTMLANFDPAQAGGAFAAVDRQFSVSATSGQIVIQFTPVVDMPTVSGIEILAPSSQQAFSPIRINAGGGAFTDWQGSAWSADSGFNTGSSYSNPQPIAGTNSPALYQKEHYANGPFQYSFNVPNGSYNVNLKFAEIFFNSAGRRIFHVAINGQTVLSNFDPAQAGGAFTAVDRQFPVAVTGGQIVIQFTPVADMPTISAIEILAAPTSFSPIRVKAGGGAYTDPQGNAWAADYGFSGGASYGTQAAIGNTAAPALYQTERFANGPFQYQFSVPNGAYTVKLKFAEIYFTSAGKRIFNVAVNGQTVLPNFDPAQAAGAFTAVDKQFSVTVTNGQIVIQFTPVADMPTVSAIEIF